MAAVGERIDLIDSLVHYVHRNREADHKFVHINTVLVFMSVVFASFYQISREGLPLEWGALNSRCCHQNGNFYQVAVYT